MALEKVRGRDALTSRVRPENGSVGNTTRFQINKHKRLCVLHTFYVICWRVNTKNELCVHTDSVFSSLTFIIGNKVYHGYNFSRLAAAVMLVVRYEKFGVL